MIIQNAVSTDCSKNFDHVIFDKNSEQLSDVISNETSSLKNKFGIAECIGKS